VQLRFGGFPGVQRLRMLERPYQYLLASFQPQFLEKRADAGGLQNKNSGVASLLPGEGSQKCLAEYVATKLMSV
jgi:hypothetical protein